MWDLQTLQEVNKAKNLVSREQLILDLRKLVKIKGRDFVYDFETFEDDEGVEHRYGTCLYSDSEGNPSCIVGAYMYLNHTPLFNVLHRWEWKYSSPTSVTVDGLEDMGWLELSQVFTPDAIDLLTRIQRYQDYGYSWGYAFEFVTGEKL